MIEIMLVDDHQIIRDGIKQFLGEEESVSVIAEATNVDDAIKKLQNIKPKVIITDLSMPRKSGFELVKYVAENRPEIGIIILSMHIEDVYIKRSINLGVRGYLPKDISQYQLIEAVVQVASGNTYFSNQVTQILMKDLVKKNTQEEEQPSLKMLTQREQEIVDLIMESLSSSQIAQKLFISTRTVENHRANIMNKLNVKSTVDLVKFIIENRVSITNSLLED